MQQLRLGDYMTYDDLGLIVTSYEIEPPQPKTYKVELPYGNGVIDLTTAITGDIAYDNRTIKVNCIYPGNVSTWANARNNIMNKLHGQLLRVVEPTDDYYYYVGRVEVTGTSFNQAVLNVEMEIDCQPYKLKRFVTTQSFTIGATGTLETSLLNDRLRAIPTFTVSADTQIEFGTYTTTIGVGEHTISAIILVAGVNAITFNAVEGTTITVIYQEGSL